MLLVLLLAVLTVSPAPKLAGGRAEEQQNRLADRQRGPAALRQSSAPHRLPAAAICIAPPQWLLAEALNAVCCLTPAVVRSAKSKCHLKVSDEVLKRSTQLSLVRQRQACARLAQLPRGMSQLYNCIGRHSRRRFYWHNHQYLQHAQVADSLAEAQRLS